MKKLLMLAIAVSLSAAAIAQTRVIAHRGFHTTDGSCRNSLAALKEAQKLGVYGSECDINLTKDGEIVVAHGNMHPDKSVHKGEMERVFIQKSTLAEVQAIPLENGEIMPTLDQYLEQTKKCKTTKLIIEVKSHLTPAMETEIVEKTVAKVAAHGLNDQVEYIAFRPWVCMELKRVAPEGTPIAYLNGDYDPTYIKAMGLSGIDYKHSVLKKKSKWIKQCQKKGLTVNVWTVNNEEDLRWFIEQGVDFITTDYPELAKRLIEEAGK